MRIRQSDISEAWAIAAQIYAAQAWKYSQVELEAGCIKGWQERMNIARIQAERQMMCRDAMIEARGL